MPHGGEESEVTKTTSKETVPQEWEELVEQLELQNSYKAKPQEKPRNLASDEQRFSERKNAG